MRNGRPGFRVVVVTLFLAACGGPAMDPHGGAASAPRPSAASTPEPAGDATPVAPAAPTTPSAAAERTALTPAKAVRFRRISRLRFSPRGDRLAFVVTEVKGVVTESH